MGKPIFWPAPPRAAAEWQALQAALADAPTPCLGEPKLWLSEDAEDKAVAVACCLHCPVRGPCGSYAERAQERHGIWAGIDRSTRAGRAK